MDRRQMLACGAGAFAASMWSHDWAYGALPRQPRPFCGVRSGRRSFRVQANAARPDKWEKNHLRYNMRGRDTRDMSDDVWDGVFRLAFDSWSEVTPLVFEQTNRSDDADILIGVGSRKRQGFGKSGGVLAWAQMPSRPKFDGTLWTMFDVAENWILPTDKEYGIILQSVACHEIGHLLGLYHSQDATALMYPYINDALKPREDDINSIQALYGTVNK